MIFHSAFGVNYYRDRIRSPFRGLWICNKMGKYSNRSWLRLPRWYRSRRRRRSAPLLRRSTFYFSKGAHGTSLEICYLDSKNGPIKSVVVVVDWFDSGNRVSCFKNVWFVLFFLVLFFAGVPWAGHCDGESHPGGAGPGPAPPAGRGHAGPGLHGDPLPRGGAPDCILLSA